MSRPVRWGADGKGPGDRDLAGGLPDFQAAVAALEEHGFVPQPGRGRTTWSHEVLPATFVGELINRRKVYLSELRDTLSRASILREAADYKRELIGETQASRALRRSRTFVETIIRSRGGVQQ